jgi:hypothetical protein
MTEPTDRPIPESFAREIAADAAMLANQVRLMNLVTAVVNPETMFSGGNVTAAELGAMAGELKEHFSWKSPPNQTVAEATAALRAVPRRPLVMRFEGGLRADDLKRRFALIGLEARSDCGGEVHVRESRVGSRLAQLEALRDEIARLQREVDDDEAEYVMDERAHGDDK